MRGVAEFDRAEVVAAVRGQRARTLALLEDLSPELWNREALPRWRVREIAAHLIATDEAALTGRLLALGLKEVSIPTIEAWNDRQVGRWADRPIPALLHALDQWGRRLARAVSVTPASMARRSLPTPFGSVSLLWLAMLRVYDEWVHCEDVCRALGLPADHSSDSVEPAARFLLAGIPVQTLPRVPRAARGRVAVIMTDVTGPAFGVDLGRRRYGLGLDEADATVAASAADLIMVAAGRTGWAEAEKAGALSIEGVRGPAETFLDALLVV